MSLDVTITGTPLSLITILFPTTPVFGTWKLTYGANSTVSLNHDATAATIQAALQSLAGLSSATVQGSATAGPGGGFVIQTNDPGPGQCLYVGLNTLSDQSGNPITLTLSSSISIDFGNNTPLILGATNNSLLDIYGQPVSIVTSGNRSVALVQPLVKAAMTIQALARLNVMNQLPAIIQNAFNLLPTVQAVTFFSPLNAGTFSLTFAVTSTPTAPLQTTPGINYNATNQEIENIINAALPSGSVSVVGGLDIGVIVLSFQNVNPTIIQVSANTTGIPVVVNTNIAYGKQLDVLAKYAGVSRVSAGPNGQITLNDSDLYTLILFGIIRNNFGSSLADIDKLLNTFFQGNINVADGADMQLSYTVNGALFGDDLINAIIFQNLLPKPMGVQVSSVIAIPANGKVFQFCDARIPTNRTGYGFNDVNSYSITQPWLSANFAV